MENLRIFIAEDHETVRAGLKMIIDEQADMTVCGEAGDGRTAVRLVQELQPDVVVMDVTMPEMNGLKATQELKKMFRDYKILALSRHTEDGYLKEILRAGASGYVLKQSAPLELFRAIRVIAAGGKYLDPAITSKVIGAYTVQITDADAPGKPVLTEREEEVLRKIAWGYSNKEIAAARSISVKTVEFHKAKAMHKLDIHDRIDIVRYALLQEWLQDN